MSTERVGGKEAEQAMATYRLYWVHEWGGGLNRSERTFTGKTKDAAERKAAAFVRDSCLHSMAWKLVAESEAD